MKEAKSRKGCYFIFEIFLIKILLLRGDLGERDLSHPGFSKSPREEGGMRLLCGFPGDGVPSCVFGENHKLPRQAGEGGTRIRQDALSRDAGEGEG